MTTTPLEGAAVDVATRGRALALPRARPRPHGIAGVLAAAPAYPFLFGLTFLLQQVGDSSSPLQVAARPLLMLWIALAALQLGIGRLAGRHVAAYFVSLLLLVLMDPLVAGIVLLTGVVPLAWRSVQARRLSTISWPALTAPMNVAAAGALGVTLLAGATGGWFYVDVRGASPAGTGTASAAAPDIYLVLLDGHPRSDELQREIGIDNGPFLAAMADLGFTVSDRSHSNYARTALTLASLFNARQVNDLVPNPPANVQAQARLLNQLINSGAALDDARSLGYEIVSIPSPVGYVTLFTADKLLQSSTATDFELALTEQDIGARIGTEARRWFFIGQHRQRIAESLQTLTELPAEPDGKPRLVFAHLLVPHFPIAFGASGEQVMLQGCEWTLCPVTLPISDTFRSAYAAQITYLDGVVEATARQMIENSSRPPVIIFFSDHGSRITGTMDSLFDNLVLSYTPGHPGLLPRDATPINLLPRLLNAYAGADLPLAPETSSIHAAGAFFPLQPVVP